MDARELAIDDDLALNMPKKPRFGVVGSTNGATGAAGVDEVEVMGDEADLELGNSTANRLLGELVPSLVAEGLNGGWAEC